MVFVRKLKETYEGVERQSLLLECELNKDNVNCVWKKYGKVIEEDDRIKIEVNGRTQKFKISNLMLSDKQNITCAAIRGRKIEEELATTSSRIIVTGLDSF